MGRTGTFSGQSKTSENDIKTREPVQKSVISDHITSDKNSTKTTGATESKSNLACKENVDSGNKLPIKEVCVKDKVCAADGIGTDCDSKKTENSDDAANSDAGKVLDLAPKSGNVTYHSSGMILYHEWILPFTFLITKKTTT